MIEIRSSSGNWTLEGIGAAYAVKYKVTDHRGTYTEQIQRSAFAEQLRGDHAVELRVEHEQRGPCIAATGRSRTMTLRESDQGLHVRATLAKDDPDCIGAVSKIRRGLLDRMSIGFHAVSESWSEDRSQRTIREARLAEISLVHLPANPGAVASVRSHVPAGIEVRFAPITLREQHAKAPSEYRADLDELELELIAAWPAKRRRTPSVDRSRTSARGWERTAQLARLARARGDLPLAQALAASELSEIEYELRRAVR